MHAWSVEISGIELRYLVNEIREKVRSGYYVSNIYGITRDAIQLRLHHPTEPDILLMISSKGIWISRFKFDSIEQSQLVDVLRKEIGRAKIEGIEQFGSERVVMLKFMLEDKIRHLIAEFFAGGNIILCDESVKILALLNPIEVRHRTLKAGVTYSYPPKRGTDVFELKVEDLMKLRSSDLDVSRWIGRNIALPKKFVEEIIRLSSIDLNAKGSELTEKDVNTLYNNIMNLVNDVCGGKHKPVLVIQDSVPVDASPIPLQAIERFEPASSYMEAVDTVLSNYLKSAGEAIKSGEFDSKINELERALEEQERARNTLIEKARFMREFASSLTSLAQQGITSITDPPVKEMIKVGFALEKERGSTMLIILDEKFAIKNAKIPSVVSMIYNRAKELENGLKSIDSAKNKLMKELERVKQQSRIAREKVKPEWQEGREWYERYRWFFTTDGLLAIGGRDASSNSAVVRRHLTDKDLVFHAEVHGSPFFVLKDADPNKSNSIMEVAQATVSFSRAWKDGLSTADAYWVHAEQVKKAAPSGQFLPKGSFVIEGKRNYIKGIGLKLAIGLIKTDSGIKVMCGSLESVKKRSIVYALITPDDSKVTDTAKKIKSEFVKNVNGELVELAKVLKLDDIVRTLPSGGCKVMQTTKGDNIALQQND